MGNFRSLGVCAIAAAGITAGLSRAASATVMSFVSVPITADALTDDPALANRVTTDLKVTVPGGRTGAIPRFGPSRPSATASSTPSSRPRTSARRRSSPRFRTAPTNRRRRSV